jgi:hypothetical protein
MRKTMIEEVIKDVLGPRSGPEESIKGDPYDEYITGVIIPAGWSPPRGMGTADPDSENVNTDIVSSGEDDSDYERPVSSEPFIRPRSFGISFMAPFDAKEIDVCVTWGRYTRSDDEKMWKRESHFCIKKFSLDEDNTRECIYSEDDGSITINVMVRENENRKKNVRVILVNELKVARNAYRPETASCIFQPSIRINVEGCSETSDTPDDYRDEMNFIYRNRKIDVMGIQCSAVSKSCEYSHNLNEYILWPDGLNLAEKFPEIENFRTPDFRTEFVPLYSIPMPSFDVEGVDELSAEKLSEAWDSSSISEIVDPLINAFEMWIESNKEIQKSMDGKNKKFASRIIKKQEEALKRLKNGLEILMNNEKARLAFCFANRVISLQHQWTGQDDDFLWRPFQLAFFLMNIEPIFNPDSEYRDVLDLLWIPTGGGKTEAYLAIIAFTMSLRRLKGSLGSESIQRYYGTAVISRYTLRLLTVQQFRRTLRMITAAEYLRVFICDSGLRGWRPSACDIKEDWLYGSVRFSAGLWVGGAVSPLHLRGNKGAIDIMTSAKEGENESEPAQVIRCPACNSWLSLPDSSESSLPAHDNTIITVVQKKKTDLNFEPSELKKMFPEIREIRVSRDNLRENHETLIIKFDERDIDIPRISEIMKELENHFEFSSLSWRRPGYFGSSFDKGRRKKKYSDFEIWCPNPDCPLNKDVDWVEGVPSGDGSEFPDGNAKRKFEGPFIENRRIPVPAYTVDEQVYSRCPTVIISTADKIARLSFEPRAAAIFGNVDKFNIFYGYHRDGLYPRDTTKSSAAHDTDVEGFLPPELIIQDELHLLDGPLGSMFGIYEASVESLILRGGLRPKYLASTATINNAHDQVRLLFGRDLFQFPPHGLEITDSFFVKEEDSGDAWDERMSGRIYMGIAAPGRGPITPQIRLWSRVLKTSSENTGDEAIRYYWTIVGYYNSLRELGGGIAFYREDVVERLKEISGDDPRDIDPDPLELSSRIDSTVLPLVLDRIERDGEQPEVPAYDAIFTTSMFGTGVDVPHLSLMIVSGQPKTTGSYIQATGRIGRKRGGLVLTFLNASRPRDMNHYEMFMKYHARIHESVEPVSVSPYSDGALNRALGPATVAFLRNMPLARADWTEEDGKVILSGESSEDIHYLQEFLANRVEKIFNREEDVEIIENFLEECIKQWKSVAEEVDELRFSEYVLYRPEQHNVVLGTPAHEYKNLKTVFRNAPNSLRDIEETTGFRV